MIVHARTPPEGIVWRRCNCAELTVVVEMRKRVSQLLHKGVWRCWNGAGAMGVLGVRRHVHRWGHWYTLQDILRIYSLGYDGVYNVE